MNSSETNLASAGVLAAELLVGACGEEKDLHVGTVRDLAQDLGRVLASISASETPDARIEAAQACADLATLAACNLPSLPEESRPAAAASVHLAAGTTRALVALAETSPGEPEGAHAAYASRDVRSAGWKADLAVRQVENEA